jgi:SNF2 family DNA or RNA helicase
MKYEEYVNFITSKTQLSGDFGFDPVFMPDQLFDFQKYLVEWAVRKGRGAIFADCGLGKSFMSLAFCQNVVEKTNGNTLVIAPLAVTQQFEEEAEKFQIECKRSKDGKPAAKITVTNYEKLHLYDPNDYKGVVCDESSSIKNYKGERKKIVTSFLRTIPYRLLSTATAAPNDYIELGTSSEALGEMGAMDMLGMFFKNNEKSLHPAFIDSKWTFKPHAEENFWKWVTSWARAIRSPGEYGFDESGYSLPEKTERKHLVKNDKPLNGMLFTVTAKGLKEQREERKATIEKRCNKVAELCEGKDTSVIWGHLNAECDLLESIIPDAKQIKGSDSDEKKEELFTAFKCGELKKLVTKPKIGAFGLNWQHCNHMTFFPSHSYEQYYQAVRRIWRFGQKRPVTIDIVMSEGEQRVFDNLYRKAEAADKMFDKLVDHMKESLTIQKSNYSQTKINLPSWVSK